MVSIIMIKHTRVIEFLRATEKREFHTWVF